MPSNNPSIDQLKQALIISEQIEKLQAQLASIFGGSSPAPAPKAAAKATGKPGRRSMSSEAREKIAAAARARWAKVKGTTSSKTAAPAKASTPAAKPPGKKGGLTDEGRARLAAMMKARWAARKKGGPAPTQPKAAGPKAAAPKAAAKKGKRTVSAEVRAKLSEAAKKRWATKKA